MQESCSGRLACAQFQWEAVRGPRRRRRHEGGAAAGGGGHVRGSGAKNALKPPPRIYTTPKPKQARQKGAKRP